MSKYLKCIVLIASMCICANMGYAQEVTSIDVSDLEEQGLLDDIESEDVDVLESYMITKEFEGEIVEIAAAYIVVKNSNEETLNLLVDAETLIYIDDEKAEIDDMQVGDAIFVYYIDETGTLKCDWIEITR